eukprot:TRINITY_DN88821_c0_g1_i1.p1 TRINITY_DN88821_c0_g1~~TRINITY_DN88821_c0_g1_i1.p1  ORF type:complete len:813 (+),score=93.63 TRINITY_DN88821_c0_g1_i1:53-2440(+)
MAAPCFLGIDAAVLILAAWIWYRLFCSALATSPAAPSCKTVLNASIAFFGGSVKHRSLLPRRWRRALKKRWEAVRSRWSQLVSLRQNWNVGRRADDAPEDVEFSRHGVDHGHQADELAASGPFLHPSAKKQSTPEACSTRGTLPEYCQQTHRRRRRRKAGKNAQNSSSASSASEVATGTETGEGSDEDILSSCSGRLSSDAGANTHLPEAVASTDSRANTGCADALTSGTFAGLPEATWRIGMPKVPARIDSPKANRGAGSPHSEEAAGTGLPEATSNADLHDVATEAAVTDLATNSDDAMSDVPEASACTDLTEPEEAAGIPASNRSEGIHSYAAGQDTTMSKTFASTDFLRTRANACLPTNSELRRAPETGVVLLIRAQTKPSELHQDGQMKSSHIVKQRTDQTANLGSLELHEISDLAERPARERSQHNHTRQAQQQDALHDFRQHPGHGDNTVSADHHDSHCDDGDDADFCCGFVYDGDHDKDANEANTVGHQRKQCQNDSLLCSQRSGNIPTSASGHSSPGCDALPILTPDDLPEWAVQVHELQVHPWPEDDSSQNQDTNHFVHNDQAVDRGSQTTSRSIQNRSSQRYQQGLLVNAITEQDVQPTAEVQHALRKQQAGQKVLNLAHEPHHGQTKQQHQRWHKRQQHVPMNSAQHQKVQHARLDHISRKPVDVNKSRHVSQAGDSSLENAPTTRPTLSVQSRDVETECGLLEPIVYDACGAECCSLQDEAAARAWKPSLRPVVQGVPSESAHCHPHQRISDLISYEHDLVELPRSFYSAGKSDKLSARQHG